MHAVAILVIGPLNILGESAYMLHQMLEALALFRLSPQRAAVQSFFFKRAPVVGRSILSGPFPNAFLFVHYIVVPFVWTNDSGFSHFTRRGMRGFVSP